MSVIEASTSSRHNGKAADVKKEQKSTNTKSFFFPSIFKQ